MLNTVTYHFVAGFVLVCYRLRVEKNHHPLCLYVEEAKHANGLEMGGELNIASAIQVAQLALKHRQNKNQQQRIIVFAGSPVKYERRYWR
ncbi:hypothetical protein M0R45_025623 [Rubus argutus]|uniref:VWFA domain-containing protein n=1 Tax=Rubus argutus TaxID=59490 RepID=A0AAW1WUI6_RUBAR